MRSLLACLCVSGIALAACAQTSGEHAGNEADQEVASRILAVENGLLPSNIVNGEPPVKMTLLDRM